MVYIIFCFVLMMVIYWTERCVLQETKRENFLFAIKMIGLEANADKTQYMVMSEDLMGGRSYSIKPDNSSFVKMDWFKY
jgi:hypothetical protein